MRIKFFRDLWQETDMTQKNFCKIIGISNSTLQKLLRGEIPKKTVVDRIIDKFDGVDDIIFTNTYRKYTPQTHPVIAIDLDGTIWEDNYLKPQTHFPMLLRQLI